MACNADACDACETQPDCSAVEGCSWNEEGNECLVQQSPQSRAEFWLGVGLYSFGAVLINLGSNIVKFGHTLAAQAQS